MPDSACSASTPDAQLFPKKFCPDCGVRVFGRTMHKQFCSDCGEARRKERDRLAAERRRRKIGIPKVKGEIFQCAECHSDFVATSKSRAKYCSGCRCVAALRSARERAYNNDNGGTRQRVGDSCACQNCGVSFIVSNKGRQTYCDPCRGLLRENKLPYLRDALRTRRRERYREDPKFALNEFMRRGILSSLGDKKGGNSWNSFVDYTVDELKSHLERQFLPGMTWENRGINGWHIDHIIPIASFSYDGPEHPDFKACWALTNLRPMWAADNIRKKDKILYLL